MSITLLSFRWYLATKYISLIIESCLGRPTLIDLNPNEPDVYPLSIGLDRCNGTCNTLDDPSDRICVQNISDDVNLQAFKMITRINETNILTKFCMIVNVNLMVKNAIQIKIGITINVDVSVKIEENVVYTKKIMFGILAYVLVG